jgi:hypothetical protein
MDTPLVVDTPDDPEFLKQFARASMLHAHLDNTLKMFVRSFEGRTIEGVLGLYRLPGCGAAPGACREARFACFRPIPDNTRLNRASLKWTSRLRELISL